MQQNHFILQSKTSNLIQTAYSVFSSLCFPNSNIKSVSGKTTHNYSSFVSYYGYSVKLNQGTIKSDILHNHVPENMALYSWSWHFALLYIGNLSLIRIWFSLIKQEDMTFLDTNNLGNLVNRSWLQERPIYMNIRSISGWVGSSLFPQSELLI